MMLTWDVFWPLLRDGGTLALMAFILFGSWRRWWIWDHQAKEIIKQYNERILALKEERDEWRMLALQGTLLADKAVTLADNPLPKTKGGRRQ